MLETIRQVGADAQSRKARKCHDPRGAGALPTLV
jgi:hypothetical protein